MRDNRIRKVCIFLGMLILFGAAAVAAHVEGGFFFTWETKAAVKQAPIAQVVTLRDGEGHDETIFLGVPILSNDEEATLKDCEQKDFSGNLLFGGLAAPVDRESATVLISQVLGDDTRYTDIVGTLTLDAAGYSLYFAPDEAFENLPKAVSEGHGFRLLIVNTENGNYTEYRVVLTNLPVLRLEGGFSHFDKDGERALSGTLTLLTPYDPDEEAYTIKHSLSSWHVRGATTSRQPKKSWKIDLIDEERGNYSMAFLGMGTDDDWVLNSMSLDDTRMKEKLSMDLWNQTAAETVDQDQMSTGRYVELVRNSTYCGVYLLQRRVDETYLQLDADTVLLKGLNTWSVRSASEGYEIEYSPLTKTETYALIEPWSNQSDCSMVDVQNFIDTHLFIQWGSMQDSSSYNNIYYVLLPEGESYRMYMVPWDTDYSMGVLWYNDFFDYQQDMSVEMQTGRVEYDAVKAVYPQLDQMTAERWFALREGVYATENIQKQLESYRRELNTAGAYARDRATWGEFYQGRDTFESLLQYFDRRLPYLDSFYQAYLP